MIEAGEEPDERAGNRLGPVVVDCATGRGDRCRVVAGRHPFGVVVGFHAFAVQDPGRGHRGASHCSSTNRAWILSAGRTRAPWMDRRPMEGSHRLGTLVYLYRVGHRLDVLFASFCRSTSARGFRGRRQKAIGSCLVAGSLKAGMPFLPWRHPWRFEAI